MNIDKAKLAILDKCCESVECLARGRVMDLTANAKPVDNETLLAMAQAFVDRKYVARADARQKEMGLAYIEAERQDLAREIVRFVQGLVRE